MNFKGLIETSLRQRGLVLAAALALLVVGVGLTRSLPVDVLPDLTRPTVTVQTEAAGLAPEDVETQVTFPIEQAVSGLQDLARLRSVSTPGLSVVYAEFDWGSDPFRNRQLVAERVDTVRAQLRPFAEPRLGPLTSLMGEVMLVGLSIDADGHDAREVREFADWTLRPRLLALPGVAQVVALGGAVRQYELRPDAARLQLNGVTLAQIEQAAQGFGVNSGAGVADSGGREWALRSLGRPFRLDDLPQTAVAWKDTGSVRGPVRLGQVAEVVEGSRLRRGDAGIDGQPAVILSIQKQPGADTVRLTRAIERVLGAADSSLPPGARRLTLFRQADFIEASIANVRAALLHGAVIVALALLLFLAGGRATPIALVAIPLSLATAVIVLHACGLAINTMTLGGLAIAVGELVDDAVVGVENVLRRLRGNALAATPRPLLRVIADATLEVRSGILYATLLIVLVFVPLFALGGVEGRLFAPLGIAYLAAILASLLVAVTVTPALLAVAFGRAAPAPRERAWLAWIKRRYAARLAKLLAHPRAVLATTSVLLVASTIAATLLPRGFLPPFNEPTLTLTVLLQPGVSLDTSSQAGQLAERLILQVPDVAHVGRRTGRAETDEHAEGLQYSEFDIALKPDARPRAEVLAELRTKLAVLPGSLSFGAPIAHRLDHLLSGVRAPFAVKISGPELDTLRTLAAQVRERLDGIAGLVDPQIEAQAEVPQLRLRVDARRAAQYGIAPPRVQDAIAALTVGRELSQIVEGDRRIPLLLRLPQQALEPARLAEQLIDTPAGPVPLRWLADIDEAAGPNQVLRENLQRRIVVSAQSASRGFARGAVQAAERLATLPLPAGYTMHIEGQSEAQQSALRQIAALSLLSLLLMIAVLQVRYRELALTLIVLATVPLALIGGIAALAIGGVPLSVASLIGFVTLAGIAARNGILKISHYLHLALDEGEPFGPSLVVRGSLERLTPVLMTSAIAALALLPLLLDAAAPGKELLHPVALVIFGGLLVGTVLDSFVTPLLFLSFGAAALERLRNRTDRSDSF